MADTPVLTPFQICTRKLNRVLRCQYLASCWEDSRSLPPAIQKTISTLEDKIKLEGPTAQLSRDLREAARNWGSAIKSISHTHLRSRVDELAGQLVPYLAKLTTKEFGQSSVLAISWARRRYGKRLGGNIISNFQEYSSVFVGHLSDAPSRKTAPPKEGPSVSQTGTTTTIQPLNSTSTQASPQPGCSDRTGDEAVSQEWEAQRRPAQGVTGTVDTSPIAVSNSFGALSDLPSTPIHSRNLNCTFTSTPQSQKRKRHTQPGRKITRRRLDPSGGSDSDSTEAGETATMVSPARSGELDGIHPLPTGDPDVVVGDTQMLASQGTAGEVSLRGESLLNSSSEGSSSGTSVEAGGLVLEPTMAGSPPVTSEDTTRSKSPVESEDEISLNSQHSSSPPTSMGNGSANPGCLSDPGSATLPRRIMRRTQGRRPGTYSTADFCMFSQPSQRSKAAGRTDLNLSFKGENLYPADVTRHAGNLSSERKIAAWKLVLKPSTSMVFLGDSNLSKVPKVTREDVEVHSFPGAKCWHLTKLLERFDASRYPQLKDVIISVGLNDCLSETTLRSKRNASFHECMLQASSTFPDQRVFFQPVYGTIALDLTFLKGIQAFNEHARKFLGNRPVAHYLNKHHAQVKQNGQDPVHWSRESAFKIIEHSLSLIAHLN